MSIGSSGGLINFLHNELDVSLYRQVTIQTFKVSKLTKITDYSTDQPPAGSLSGWAKNSLIIHKLRLQYVDFKPAGGLEVKVLDSLQRLYHKRLVIQ